MAIKQMVLADMTTDIVTQRIKDIADGKKDPVSRTCWNVVAMYLRKNENTVGSILLYTSPGPPPHTVAHAMLVDKAGNTLCDSLHGERGPKDATYKRKGFDEVYVLLDKIPWPL